MIGRICSTKNDKTLGVVRVLLGLLFVGTGSMKFLVPMLWTAWSGQLTQARIPFYAFNLYFVPIIEIVTGVLLIVGLFSRVGGIVVVAMMAVATYVHLVVVDPTLFPLQPEKPVIPMVALAMAAYIVWRGGGAWSLDLKASSIVRKIIKISMRTTLSATPAIQCSRILPTSGRRRSKGTYIVELSPNNSRRLKVRNGTYVEVNYGEVSVLARLSVDADLDDETIRMDATVKNAICLPRGQPRLVYSPDGDGKLSHPILIRRSNSGPSVFARLLKPQYLICAVHHAMPADMDKPVVRLSKEAMEAIRINPQHRVVLISKRGRIGLRCLALDPETRLPLETMRHFIPPPCPDPEGRLPWVTLDLHTRLALGVTPWHPILVGPSLPRVVAREAALVVTLMGLVVAFSQYSFPEVISGWAILVTGTIAVAIYTLIKIKARL